MSTARDPRLLVIFLTVLLDLIGFGIIIPLLPFYAKDMGADAVTVGALLTCYSLAQLLSSSYWGRLSDRVGRRPVLLGTILFSTAAMFTFGIAEALPVLFVSRILAGIGAGNIGAAQAYIADITRPEERARGMGMIGAAFGLGFIFGPAIGGPLAHVHHAAPGMAAASLSLLNFLLAWRWLPESHPDLTRGADGTTPARTPPLPTREALSLPGVGIVVGMFFVFNSGFSILHTVFSLSSAALFGLDQAQVGYLFAWIGVVAVTVQGGLIGKLSRRYGASRLTVVGLWLTTGALALNGVAPTVGVVVLALGLLGLGNGLANPSMSSQLSGRVEVRRQGTVLGIAQAAGSLGRMAGPLLGGFIYDRWGPRMPYLAGAAILAVAALMAVFDAARPPDPLPGGDPPRA